MHWQIGRLGDWQSVVRVTNVDWKNTAVAGAVGISAITSTLAQVPPGLPRFASTTELISLNVTVTDQSRQCLTSSPAYWTSGWDGCPVIGLSQNAFRITEDGLPQTIALFDHGDVPIAMFLVLDVHSSAKVRISEVHDAAAGMVERLRSQDRAAVVGSENGVEVYHPLTGNRRDLERAIRRTSLRTPVSPANLLSSVLRRSAPFAAVTDNAIRRQAIVFLTDTQAPFDPGALSLARQTDATVYVIGFTGDEPLEQSREPAASLRRLANASGGRAFFPGDGRRLSSAYNQIYDELSRQYTIGYISTNTARDGKWRNVIVRVERANTSTRARQGYFAPEA